MLPDPLAEGQQRRVHVRHPGQIPGVHGVIQRVRQFLHAQRHGDVLAAQPVPQTWDEVRVGVGLEFSGGEVLAVVGVVHGKGDELFPPAAHVVVGDGADDAGV